MANEGTGPLHTKLNDSILQIEADGEKLHSIVNGSDTTEIAVGEPDNLSQVPTVSKAIKDSKEAIAREATTAIDEAITTIEGLAVQGKYREFAYKEVDKGSETPEKPVVTYNSSDAEFPFSLSDDWSRTLPESFSQSTKDYYEVFWIYDPANKPMLILIHLRPYLIVPMTSPNCVVPFASWLTR